MECEKLKPSAFLIQCLATCCICYQACLTGFVSAWPSFTVILLRSNETVLDRPMTSLDISWLGGLPNVGGLVASPFCGYIFDTIGRKYATILFVFPYVFTWIIIIFANNVPLVLVAMTLGGVGIAGQNVSLIYISEISHNSIRGGTTAFSGTGYFIGILIAYGLGGSLSYTNMLYTNLALSILCVLLLMLLKESPVFLVMIRKEEEAAKSIAFYNRVEVTSKLVEMEIRKIKIQLDPRLEKILENEKDDDITEGLIKAKLGELMESRKESAWRIFKKSKSSKRILVAVLVLIAATAFMGNIAVQVYAEPLFKEAVPSMSSNLCSIILAVDFTIASIICVLVIDKYGRKGLLKVTSVFPGVCCVFLGSQLQFHWAPHWFTALLIYIYSFLYTVGCPIPFVLMAEAFLPEVRSLCSSVSMGFLWVVNFIMLFAFNPLVEAFGLGPVFYGFSAVCFLGALYTQLRVSETKGLSVDAIQAKFLKM